VENCELAGWPDLSLSPSAILQELDSTSLVSSPKKHTARPKSPDLG